MAAQDLPTALEISESLEPHGVRVKVAGELDVAVIYRLQQRLDSLARVGETVVLDLSDLAFIDSSGLNVIVTTFRQAKHDGWELRIEPNLTAPVLRVVKLMGLDAIFWPS
jgi:anti-sigma B factor antagonist